MTAFLQAVDRLLVHVSSVQISCLPCGNYITAGPGTAAAPGSSIGRMSRPPPDRPTRMATLRARRWRLLAVTGMGAFLGPFDVSVAAVALPAIGRDLDLTFSGAIWIQAGYLLPYALVLIPAGRIADQWGRLRVFRIGMVVFALTSLMAAVSPNIEWMLAWRAVQGGGGAMLAATSTALVTAAFPPGERGRALGLNIMVLYLGLSHRSADRRPAGGPRRLALDLPGLAAGGRRQPAAGAAAPRGPHGPRARAPGPGRHAHARAPRCAA